MHEPKTVELKGGIELIVTWDDERRDHLSAAMLRASCPCAECRVAVPPLQTTQFEATTILNVAFVGGYAINLSFSPDGHATGIYPYGLLRYFGETREHPEHVGERSESRDLDPT